MNTEVTQDQIDYYQLNGFLLLDEFLTADELERLRIAVTAGVGQMGKQKLAGEGREMVEGDEYYDRVFLQRVNLWKINETVKSLFLDPALGEMLCKLEGIDGIRVWHDQTLQKQPWSNPTSWHSDVPSWSFDSPHAISIWVALDDATVQNGCLYYLPGSHKTDRRDQTSAGVPEIGEFFVKYPEFQDTEPVPAVLKSGQAALHNGLMAHGAGPNMSPGWRRAMICAYMPDGATFNGTQNILSEKQMAELQIGDVMNDEKQNPLVWKRG